VLCSSANKLQQNSKASSRKDYIPQILTVLLEILRVYIWPLWPFVFCLSFVNNSLNNVTTPSTNQRFWPDSGQILRHQFGISFAESQTFLRAKRPHRRRARRNRCFRRLDMHMLRVLTSVAWIASCLTNSFYIKKGLAFFRNMVISLSKNKSIKLSLKRVSSRKIKVAQDCQFTIFTWTIIEPVYPQHFA